MNRVSAIAMALFMIVSPAAAAEIEFRGALCITSITPTCSLPGWVVGCHVNFRFAPRFLGDNGDATRLSVFDGFLASNYTMASGSPYGNNLRNVAGTRFGRSVSTFNSQWRFTSQSPNPGTLTATSPAVTFSGTVTTWDNIADCQVTFKGSGINTLIP